MGPGYVVGEPYERLRAGEPGEELVRPGYYSDILGATYEALERAEALVGAGTRPEAAAALLHAFAALVSGTVALDLERPGPLLTRARISAGLSKAELARRAGVSRTTVKDVESGRVNPHTGTVARLFAACSDL